MGSLNESQNYKTISNTLCLQDSEDTNWVVTLCPLKCWYPTTTLHGITTRTTSTFIKQL